MLFYIMDKEDSNSNVIHITCKNFKAALTKNTFYFNFIHQKLAIGKMHFSLRTLRLCGVKKEEFTAETQRTQRKDFAKGSTDTVIITPGGA